VETLTLFDVDETTLGAGAARIASNLSLHGADAVYVALAHELNIPLYTWDKDVQNKTKGFITVNIP
jgi:predicted nucleic acid-binding protein